MREKRVSRASGVFNKASSYAGRPISCILPWAEAENLCKLLQGDATITGQATSSSYRDVGRLMAVLLNGLDPAQRSRALSVAQSEMGGPKSDVIPLAALMPENATIQQLRRLWNGWALMLLSLGTASADTSVGSVIANTAAMASGSPFASDPMVGERQNEVILAKAILEAALLGDEDAKKWYEDNKLSEALERMVLTAKAGRTDAESIAKDAYSRLAEMYDCYLHDEPLGGDVLEGGALADFFSNVWNGVKQSVGSAVSKAGSSIASSLGYSGSAGGGSEASSSVTDGGSSVVSPPGDGDLSETVASELSAAKEAVAQAKAALDGGQTNIAEYRAKLQDAALQQAKLQWADAILNAPTDVATILAAASPNMADPAGFLQSMLSTLSAAKTTGNLGTLKALLYALKAAASKGDSASDSLYSLITGDPDNVSDGVMNPGDSESPLYYKLLAQKDELAVTRNTLQESVSQPDTKVSPNEFGEVIQPDGSSSGKGGE